MIKSSLKLKAILASHLVSKNGAYLPAIETANACLTILDFFFLKMNGEDFHNLNKITLLLFSPSCGVVCHALAWKWFTSWWEASPGKSNSVKETMRNIRRLIYGEVSLLIRQNQRLSLTRPHGSVPCVIF